MAAATWLGERMAAEGVITAAQLHSARQNMKLRGERIEEALLQVGAVDEAQLLKFAAEKAGTRFVSTEKLAKATIAPILLRMVPERTAVRLFVFPILWDERSGTLSIVTPDAGDSELIKEIAMAAQVGKVTAYVARPAGVKAAISRWYRGDKRAFTGLESTTYAQIQETAQLYEQRVLDESGLIVMKELGSAADRLSEPPQAASPSPAPLPAPIPVPIATPPPEPEISFGDIAELLNVLVSLLENARGELRGHSSAVSRLAKQLAVRMGLEETEVASVTVAAEIHDFGKMGVHHLTTFNVSEYEGHRATAQKVWQTPIRLMESVKLPPGAASSVAAMYERFDGRGFPSRLTGKDIPLGARILAICDTFADLTANPRNPFRKALSPTEAHEVLVKYRDRIFDPDLVELFGLVVAGEDLKKRLGADRPHVLLVEPDAEEGTVLELRLVAQGFEVKAARTADQALRIATEGGMHFVLSEVDLEPYNGFELLSRIRADERTRSVPFVFVARSSETADIDRAFAAGAADYVVKPTSGDVLAAKLKRLRPVEAPKEAEAKGVAGSLKEMALPDLVQILAQGRKSGKLAIDSDGKSGEVYFDTGKIVHAAFGPLTGEKAFYEMLAIVDGRFALDPSTAATQRTIEGNPEMLLLEGLRQLDERRR